MLYLFGRLALSDSLSYHEDFPEYNYQENPIRNRRLEKPGPEARAAAISRRLRRRRYFPQAGRAAARPSC